METFVLDGRQYEVIGPEGKPELLPEQRPSRVTVPREEVRMFTYTAEVSIARGAHPGTGEKHYWPVVLGNAIGRSNDIRSRSWAQMVGLAAVDAIREERIKRIEAQMAAEAAIQVAHDADTAERQGESTDAVLAETVAREAAVVQAAQLEQWSGVNTPGVPVDAHLEAAYELAQGEGVAE